MSTLDHLSINVITPKFTGNAPVNVITRESSSPKNALIISIEGTAQDGLVVSFNVSTKDAVIGSLFPSRTGRGDQHEDDGGHLYASARGENAGMFTNTIKRVDTDHGEIVSVITRESSSPKNALLIGLLTGDYSGLLAGEPASDHNFFEPVPGFMTDPVCNIGGAVGMYVDTVGNTISDQKSRGGVG